MNNDIKYIACINDNKGRILRAVSGELSRTQAEEFLKKNYYSKWINCEAIPQLANNHNIHN